MSQLDEYGLEMIEEEDAIGQVADIYENVKRELQVPNVPDYLKVLAMSPSGLQLYWDMYLSYIKNITLPQSLISMISYTIAQRNNCTYCSALHELTCRTLGVDETTLKQLAEDLDSVNPERIRVIIDFAVKVAKYPKTVTAADYDNIRQYGISNDEIMQIALVAGIAAFNDILADTIKIDVDADVQAALAG